jgi:signal transduction histidine kinase
MRGKWLLAALVLVPVAADLLSALAPHSDFWPRFLPGVYYACIVIAGLEFGWKTGLGVAMISGILHAIIGRMLTASPYVQLEAQLLAFLIVGFALFELRRHDSEQRGQIARAATRDSQSDACLDLVSAMTHELLGQIRTPFASIEGAAFIAAQPCEPRAKREEFLGIIMKECKRIQGILFDLEESTEMVALSCRPTDASSILSEVARMAAMEFPEPNISLRIEVAPDLPLLWCDPVQIEQTMAPFVTGAMQSIGGSGEILLAADRKNGHARLQMRILEQTVRGSDPAAGVGSFSSTFQAPQGTRVLAARRTALQHGGTITFDETGHLKKLICLTLPLYGQTS